MSYAGISPTIPLWLSKSLGEFVASVNCSLKYVYCKLPKKFLYPNLNPVFKLISGINSTLLPSTLFSWDDVYSESVKDKLVNALSLKSLFSENVSQMFQSAKPSKP